MDSRLKIQETTEGGIITPEWILSLPLSVIPECFYQESKLFKDKNIWISDKRFRK